MSEALVEEEEAEKGSRSGASMQRAAQGEPGVTWRAWVVVVRRRRATRVGNIRDAIVDVDWSRGDLERMERVG